MEFAMDTNYISEIHKQNLEYLQSLNLEGTVKEAEERNKSPKAINEYWQPHIEKLLKNLLDVLIPSLVTNTSEHIAFGVVNLPTMNAACMRSHDGKYAIVLNRGLFAMVSKLSKLYCALSKIEAVKYCSRKNLSDLSKQDIESYIVEIIENYKKYHVPYGVQIVLNNEFLLTQGSELLLFRGLFISMIELFIMGHELGHYINGDLEKDYSPTTLEGCGIEILQKTVERNLDIEYKADRFGYFLTANALKNIYAGMLSQEYIHGLLVSNIGILFDLFHSFYKESRTHPKPRKRILSIIEYFYGTEDAELYSDSYDKRLSAERTFHKMKLVPKQEAWLKIP